MPLTSGRRRLLKILIVLAGFGVLGIVVALFLTTPPKPVGLSSPGPTSTATAAVGDPTTPNGVWLVPQERGPTQTAFVGYRVHEKFGFDFVIWPNEAVGRSEAVTGRLEIRDGALQVAEIEADLDQLRSDYSDRDRNVADNALLTGQYPTAKFRLTEPVSLAGIGRGQATEIEAHGELTIKGVTKPVVWPLLARWDGDVIEVAGQLKIDRLDYGVDMGRFLVLRVDDEVTLEAQLQFVRECLAACPSPAPRGSPGIVPGAPSPTPAVSPVPAVKTISGGGQIAMTVGSGDRSHVYVVDLGTGALTAMPSVGTDEFFPFWSADGSRLGWVKAVPFGTSINLVLAKADGSSPVVVANPAGIPIGHPSFSPDGKRIAFFVVDIEKGGDIFVTDLTGAATRLTGGSGIDEAEDEPAWSPDGKSILYVRFGPGTGAEDIWIMAADGSNARALTTDAGYEYDPAWSPDGRRIAYAQDGRITVMAADGSGAVALTDGTQDSAPTWSPDGTLIAFVRDRQLHVMNSDGSDLVRFEFESRIDVVLSPAWRP
jgi:polyisoprenoid-binding protein YceI